MANGTRAAAADATQAQPAPRVPSFSAHDVWQRGRRPLALTLKIVAAVAIVYEIALNAFLMCGGLSHVLSGNPDKLLVEYGAGWSIVPGFVHARSLRIRSKDGHFEFDLRIEQCAFRVALLPLTRKEFHVLHVKGSGITFAGRTRMPESEATPEKVAELPPIGGLEAVPLLGPEPPPPDDAHYNLMTFAIDNVDAEQVREVWMNALRFEGSAHILGSFYLKPIRWASVGPVKTIIESGRFAIGKNDITTQTEGTLDTSVDGFDPRITRGPETLHKVTVHAVLRATFPSHAVHSFAPKALVIEGGPGNFSMDVRVDHGRVVDPSRAEAQAQAMEVTVTKATFAGALDASFKTTARPQTTVDAAVTLGHVRVTTPGFESVPATIEHAQVALRSTELDLAEHPFSNASVSLRLPMAHIPDARFVDAWLDESGGSMRVQGGSGTFGADLDVAAGVAKGQARLALEDAKVDVGRNETFSGQVRAEIDLQRWGVAAGRLDLSGTRVEVLDVAMRGGTAGWWADVSLPVAEIDVHGGASFRGHVVARARDTRPFASALVGAKDLPSWVGSVVSVGDVRATASVGFQSASQTLDVRDLEASAGPFRVQGMATKRGPESQLIGLVSWGPLSVGLESVGGQTRVQIADLASWYAQRTGRRPTL